MENNIFPIARTYFHVIPQMAWLGLFSICLYLFIEHARALGLGPILFRTPIQERAQQHINRPFFCWLPTVGIKPQPPALQASALYITPWPIRLEIT